MGPTMNELTIEALAERVDELRRECVRLDGRIRRWKRWFGLALVGVLLASAFGLLVVGSPRAIRAEQFVLEDEHGQPRAILGVRPTPPVRYAWLDRVLTRVGVRRRSPMTARGFFGPCLSFLDETGARRATIGLNTKANGVPFLTLSDPGEMDRLAIYTSDEGAPRLQFRDPQQRTRLELVSTREGFTFFTIHGPDGRATFEAPPPATPEPKPR